MKPIKSTMYSPQEIQLAQELAKELGDEKSISFYLSCTKKYSHRKIRSILAQVLAVPQADIWKSRGALFTNLISHSDKVPNDYSDNENDTYRHENPWN